MDSGSTSGLTPGTTINLTVPLSSYPFATAEFPLLLGLERKEEAVVALEEVYLTHPTPTTWEVNISGQVIEINNDRIQYNVYYYGSRNT